MPMPSYKCTFVPAGGRLFVCFPSSPLRFGSKTTSTKTGKMYQIGNIYGITGIAVIGGGLFGFDISSMSAMYVWVCSLDALYCGQLTHLQPANATVPMLLQPRTPWPAIHGKRGMLGPYGECAGWNHGGDAWWLLCGFAPLWLPDRQVGSEAGDSDWMYYLDYWLHHLLRVSEHWHAHCWSLHQRYFGRYLLCSSPRLCHRVGATVQAWSCCRFATVGHHLGYSGKLASP